MHNLNFEDDLASRGLEILSKQIPEEAMLQEFSQLVQSSIAHYGRGTDLEPNMAAALEERLNLNGLSIRQKLDQSRDIIEFIQYCEGLMKGTPSKIPEIVKRAEKISPNFSEFVKGLRVNLN